MKSPNCETVQLESGLRIIVSHRPGQVAYCGIAVDAGTRDQLDNESGMAHFVEHMSFKGTEHRRSWHIINRMDAVGGDLNAYTGKEHTVYYCTCLRQHLHRALDLLFDITLRSTYPQREIDKEVEVVIDEIESYKDSPSELIFDDFEALIFQGHPLGRNILGDADSLRRYQTPDLLRFARRLYHPSHMVLFARGDVTLRQIERMVASHKGEEDRDSLESRNERRGDASILPAHGEAVHHRDLHTHQAHVIIGAPAYALSDPRRPALNLLNNILGGPGMNSRLNLNLRERHGLVYTVESSLASYTDAGVWMTYFGCDHSDVRRCQRMVMRELARLCDAPLSHTALLAAKRQIKGQLGISWENAENVAINTGLQLLHTNKVLSRGQVFEQIDSLTAEQLWQTAREVFDPDRLVTLVYE